MISLYQKNHSDSTSVSLWFSARVSVIWATLFIHLFTAFLFSNAKPVAIAPILSWKTRDNRKQKNIYYNIEISYMQLQAHKHKYLYIITVQCNNKLPDNSNNNKRRKIKKPKLAHKSQEIFSLTAYATYAWYLHNEIHNSAGCLVWGTFKYMFLWCICCVCFPAQLQLATVLDHLAALGNSTSNFSRHCNSFSRGDNVNARQILRTQRGYLHRNHWLFKQIINAISSLDISNQSIKWRGTFCVSAKLFQCPFLDYTVTCSSNRTRQTTIWTICL